MLIVKLEEKITMLNISSEDYISADIGLFYHNNNYVISIGNFSSNKEYIIDRNAAINLLIYIGI